MSLVSFIRSVFLEYAQTNNIQLCVNINCDIKSQQFYYSVFYNEPSDQLILEGYKQTHEGPEEVFQMYEEGNSITVGEMIMECFPLVDGSEEVSIHNEGSLESFLDTPLAECVNRVLWVNPKPETKN
jgi:uncharacterized protein with von Willebrand factor type A (vWA) domain